MPSLISGVIVSVNVNVIRVLPVMSLKLKLLGYYCVVCGVIGPALVLNSVLVVIPTTITGVHVCEVCHGVQAFKIHVRFRRVETVSL